MPTVDVYLPELNDDLYRDWMDLLIDREPEVPIHDPFDPLPRCLLLNAVFQLSRMYFAIDIPEDAARARAWARRQFGNILEQLPVNSIEDPDRVAWEVTAAASGDRWTRTTALFDRWREVDPGQRDAIELLRGRVLWLSLWNRRASPEDRMDLWLPGRGSLGDLSELMVFVRAVSIVPTGEGTWLDPATLSREETERLIDAIAAFEKAGVRVAEDLPSTSVLACCRYLRGAAGDDATSLKQAAILYRELARDAGGWQRMNLQTDAYPVGRLYECAVTCFKRGRMYAEAEGLIREWMTRVGEKPAIWEHLSEAQICQNDVKAAGESILHAIANSEKYATDWKASLLVGLATRPDSITALETVLGNDHAQNPEMADLAVAITKRYWPSFGNLTIDAQERWIYGLRLLYDPRWTRQLPPLRLQSAAHAFAIAVETELKSKVFSPFVSELDSIIKHAGSKAPADSAAGVLARYAQRRADLRIGQMVFYLRQHETEADPIVDALIKWVMRRMKALLGLAPQLGRLVAHRNGVSHGALSQEEVADLERLTESVLQVLSEAAW